MVAYIFYNNHYTKYVDQMEIWLLDVYNYACRQGRISEREAHKGKAGL